MPSEQETRDWIRRIGRFRGLALDTPDRPQVMPVPEPPVERQTHNEVANLERDSDDD